MANALYHIGRIVRIYALPDIDFHDEEDVLGMEMQTHFKEDVAKWDLIRSKLYPQRGVWNIRTGELEYLDGKYEPNLLKRLNTDFVEELNVLQAIILLVARSKHGKDLTVDINPNTFFLPFYAKLNKLVEDVHKVGGGNVRAGIYSEMRHVVYEAVHKLMKTVGSLKPIVRACLDEPYAETEESASDLKKGISTLRRKMIEPVMSLSIEQRKALFRWKTEADERNAQSDSKSEAAGSMHESLIMDSVSDFNSAGSEYAIESESGSRHDDDPEIEARPPISRSEQQVTVLNNGTPLSNTYLFLRLYCAYNAYRLTEHNKPLLSRRHPIGTVLEDSHWGRPFRHLCTVYGEHERIPSALMEIHSFFELGARLEMFLGGRAKGFVTKDLVKIEKIEHLADLEQSLRDAIHYYGFYLDPTRVARGRVRDGEDMIYYNR